MPATCWPNTLLAMKHGLGLNKMLGTVHLPYAVRRANKYAAGEWKRAHQPHRLLDWSAQVPRLEARMTSPSPPELLHI